MAQYKVPQDVEADDKLLGPFSFRQFVYLLIAAGLLALAVGLFQLFPILAIIPLPPVVLLVALALPLKKDQPMETYLAAMVSYYLKPRTRMWVPGQRESTITITAPKKVEENRTRDITGEEATHRLSFLADIVDTGGYAIKGMSANPMREDLVAEASMATDMFEGGRFATLESIVKKDEDERHAEMVKKMQATIEKTEDIMNAPLMEEKQTAVVQPPAATTVPVASAISATPAPAASAPAPEEPASLTPPVATAPVEEKAPTVENPVENSVQKPVEEPQNNSPKAVKPSIMELANNDAFSVATIAQQAKRINRKEKGEVFISLH